MQICNALGNIRNYFLVGGGVGGGILGRGDPISLRIGAGGGGEGGGGELGVLATMKSPNAQAQDVICHVRPEARQFIIDMAIERARNQHSTSLALDARITQASYIQLGAAAAAGAFASASGANIACIVFSIASLILFMVGGLLCFRGIRSDSHHAPGLPPAWWHNVTNIKKRFDLYHAQCWAAGAIQDMMDEVEKENVARSSSLNLSLRYALGGGVAIALAAIARCISL